MAERKHTSPRSGYKAFTECYLHLGAPPVPYSVKTKVLRRAAESLGGVAALRRRLGAAPGDLADWLAGTREPPEAAFLRALDVVLGALDAEERDSRKGEG